MKTKKSRIIIIIVSLLIIISCLFIGYSFHANHNTVKYGDYITFTFEDNNMATLSLDLESGKYYYSNTRSKSTSGELKKLDKHIYKFYSGSLKEGYLILPSTSKEKTIYIHDDLVTYCSYINNQITITNKE